MMDMPEQILEPDPKVPDTTEYHFMTLHFVVVFRAPDGVGGGMKHVNMVVPRVKNTLPMLAVQQGAQAAGWQMVSMGIPLENIMDVTHVATSYHGLMTEAEFREGTDASALVSTDEVVKAMQEAHQQAHQGEKH